MHLRKVYIRYREDMPESTSTFAALDGFRQLGVETAPFYGFGDIDTLEDLGPEVGVVGFVGDVLNALKKIGKPKPEAINYPEELQEWLGRRVWQSTLGEMRKTRECWFIKPVEEKVFTGFVWRSGATADQIKVAMFPDETPLWVSERVNFESEYRTYVQDDKIVGLRIYKGDWSKVPDRSCVEAAVKAYKSSPRACSLDFGVTEDGRTLLVEANDGYALGNYGLPAIPYAQFIEARWEELTR